MVEHLTFNQGVVGSSPTAPTNKFRENKVSAIVLVSIKVWENARATVYTAKYNYAPSYDDIANAIDKIDTIMISERSNDFLAPLNPSNIVYDEYNNIIGATIFGINVTIRDPGNGQGYLMVSDKKCTQMRAIARYLEADIYIKGP